MDLYSLYSLALGIIPIFSTMLSVKDHDEQTKEDGPSFAYCGSFNFRLVLDNVKK